MKTRVSVPEPKLEIGRSRSQNKRNVEAESRIGKMAEPEPELINPSLNWSRPNYARLVPRDVNIYH